MSTRDQEPENQGTEAQVRREAVELAESFVDGNISDVVRAIQNQVSNLHSAFLALAVCAELKIADRLVLERALSRRIYF